MKDGSNVSNVVTSLIREQKDLSSFSKVVTKMSKEIASASDETHKEIIKKRNELVD
ncbi:MAG: hypothetical protein ACRCXZ_09950 [Patescibacteria group bacterium]